MTARTIWAGSTLLLAALAAAAPGDRKAPPWEKSQQVGRALFRENCSVCHVTDRPRSTKIGPSLFRYKKLLATRYKPGHDFIAAKVKSGSPLMPAFQDTLTDEQIDLIVAHLASAR